MTFANGGFVNAMLGQSSQIAGANSYSTADAANVGLNSGLNIARLRYRRPLRLRAELACQLHRQGPLRQHQSDREAHRPCSRRINFDPLTLQFQYANYASQPAIGFGVRRQGLSANGRYDITKNYFLNGIGHLRHEPLSL